MRARRFSLPALALVALPTAAYAADVEPPPPPRQVHISWTYVEDSYIPKPGEAVMSGAIYDETRTVSGLDPQHGDVFAAHGIVGLTDSLSLVLDGIRVADVDVGHGASGMATGLQLALFSIPSFRLVASGGYAEALGGGAAGWSQLAAAGGTGRFAWGASERTTALFQNGALGATWGAGASYRVNDFLRVGGEYFGQVSKARSFQGVRPTVSTTVLNDSVRIAAGPTLGTKGIGSSPARISIGASF